MAIKLENAFSVQLPASGTTTQTFNLGFTPTEGNFLTFHWLSTGPARTLLNINQEGVTWTISYAEVSFNPGAGNVVAAYAENVAPESDEFSVDWMNFAPVGGVIAVCEFSGVEVISPLDVETFNENTSSSTVDSGIASATQTGTLGIGFAASEEIARTLTLSSTGYIPVVNKAGGPLTSDGRLWVYYQVNEQVDSETFAGSLDSSSDNTAGLQLFKRAITVPGVDFVDPFPKIENHVEQAQNNLITQFKNKVSIRALIETYVKQIQDIEAVFCQLLEDVRVDTATGVTLDNIGTIVAEARNGRTDSAYRTALFAKIRTLSSQGTIEDIIQVLEAATGGGVIVTITEVFPARAVIEVDQTVTTPLSTEQIVNLLQLASPAGIDLNFSTSDSFRFDTPGSGFNQGVFGGAF